jgi:hypothetical protein
LFLFPGFGLFMFGLVTFIAVLPGPLQIGSVRFDVHTLLLSSSALLVGSQIVILFLLAKQFATNNGLIPVGENFLKYRRWMTLERGVVLGAVLTVLGLAGSVYAVIVWAGRGFGALDYSSMMRLVVPSITLLALGVQVIMLAFLSSILDLSLRSR